MVRFRPASEIHGDAMAIAEAVRVDLRALIPDGELVLTGASSDPRLLTSGDVDLQLRVPASSFRAAVGALRRAARVVLPEIWTDDMATFELDGYPHPTGLAVTAVDGEHDRLFMDSWRRIAADPSLVERYNALKRQLDGGDAAAYRAAKARFFDSIAGGNRSHPARGTGNGSDSTREPLPK